MGIWRIGNLLTRSWVFTTTWMCYLILRGLRPAKRSKICELLITFETNNEKYRKKQWSHTKKSIIFRFCFTSDFTSIIDLSRVHSWSLMILSLSIDPHKKNLIQSSPDEACNPKPKKITPQFGMMIHFFPPFLALISRHGSIPSNKKKTENPLSSSKKCNSIDS